MHICPMLFLLSRSAIVRLCVGVLVCVCSLHTVIVGIVLMNVMHHNTTHQKYGHTFSLWNRAIISTILRTGTQQYKNNHTSQKIYHIGKYGWRHYIEWEEEENFPTMERCIRKCTLYVEQKYVNPILKENGLMQIRANTLHTIRSESQWETNVAAFVCTELPVSPP